MNRKNTKEGLVIQIYRYEWNQIHIAVANKCKILKILMSYSKVEHPDYASTGSLPIANDVALLRLHQGLDLSDSPNINSICWPTVAPAVGLQVTASGWGFEWQHLGLFGNAKVLKKVRS